MTEEGLGKRLRKIIESNKEGTNNPTGAHSISYRLCGLMMFINPKNDLKYQKSALKRWGKGEFETIKELREAIKQLIMELRDELPWPWWNKYFWTTWITYLAEDAQLKDEW